MSKDTRKTSRRTHITTACDRCRESKIKCDGSRPKCGNCQKGRPKLCIYQQEGDRRHISLRKAVEVFSSRLSQLERFIEVQSLEIPAPKPEDELMLKRLLATPDIPGRSDTLSKTQFTNPGIATSDFATPCNQFSQESLDQDLQGFSRDDPILSGLENLDAYFQELSTPPLLDNHQRFDALSETSINAFNHEPLDWDIINSNSSLMPADFTPTLENFYYPSSSGNPDLTVPVLRGLDSQLEAPDLSDTETSQSSDDDKDELIEQISYRMGSLQIAEDGELRYFGATSNLNLLDNTWQQTGHEGSYTRSRTKEIIKAAGLGELANQTIIDHLTNLYFAWEDSSLHVVDREVYEEQRKRYEVENDVSTFYSETLTNAICAFGSLYNFERASQFPPPEFFFDRAKVLLELELDNPRVATVQALIIMSNYEAACTKDARGWLYSGMAVRIALDLGLHVDMSFHVESGQMSKAAAEVRKVAFWGSFVINHVWGFYLGRPPMHIKAEEISVKKPIISLDETQQTNCGLHGSVLPSTNLSRSVLVQWVQICEIMSDLSYTVYGCINVTKHVVQALAANVHVRIDEWYRDLPEDFRVDADDQRSDYAPHVLLLGMQHQQFLIYIHRPFISKYSYQPYPPVGRGSIHARETSINCAVTISKLLTKYKLAYGLRYVNLQIVSIVFSAALILVFATVSEIGGQNHADLDMHLSTCCDALEELGNTFQNATRALRVLYSIKQTWQAKLLTSTGSKRRSSKLRGSGNVRKRRSGHQPSLSHIQANSTLNLGV